MKNTALIFLFTLLVSCNPAKELNVPDVTKEMTFNIEPNSAKSYSLVLKPKGILEGESSLQIFSEDSLLKFEVVLSGKVDTIFRFDWYEEKGKLKYEPISTKSGKLTIEYRFYD